jgi:hypothetical protein
MLPGLCLSLLAGSGQVLAHGGEDHVHPAESTSAHVAASAVPVGAGQAVAEAASRLPDGSVFVPKSLQRQLGLRTVLAEAGEFPRVLELNGRIVADPNAGGRVQTVQGGRIEAGPQGLAMLGQRVGKGQILAWLQPATTAMERSTQQASVAELAAQEAQLEKRVARLHILKDAVAQKDVEQAEIELRAFRQRRQAMQHGMQREALRAPVSGVISAVNVVVGQVVEAREIVFEVLDPDRLAVEAQVFDPLLLDGVQAAHAPVNGGVLALNFIGMGRSLKAQAMPVLFRVQPPKSGGLPLLAVGQTLKVLVQTRSRLPGVAVPAAAAGRNAANEAIVWVHESAERFVPRKVVMQPLDGERILLTSGIPGKARVVSQGAEALGQLR